MFITFKNLLKSNIYIGNNFQNIHFNNYKFIYKIKYNNCILNFTLIALYLYKLYIYIYNIFLLNQKILFINNNNNLMLNFIIKICNLTNNFYIIKWIPGLLTNWSIFKKKIIIYIWLYKLLKNKYLINIISKKCLIKLNIIYNKLNNKFKGIKYMLNIPKYIFLTNFNNDLILNEILKLKLILISFINLSLDSNIINIKILGNYNNYKSLKLIYQIIYTSIIHSKIKNM
ncbi:apicoplast ribosomal protein S2, putative (apicoplast) [Plasmodium gallinaceum]|uniref:Apicoplast ribosomal protein S2, putative n=1 Tax=Plasmodium gallinaceum TaxID=5849 RepID=H7CDY9_PLAGA|nr:apicoplast ribosomal protein S2, putative [Plasmodium gallinaceum]BAL70759.1 small subunit ribosomal protein 2 [Plasmodium gallinaceum]CRG98249.1 apicoplast ribosomal protein S2, putative [Plasmodium gallinaceum]